MDTKLKKSKPFRAWLTFFIAVSIILSLMVTSLAILEVADSNLEVLRSPFVDYKESYPFKSRTSFYFNGLLSMTLNNSDSQNISINEYLMRLFEQEGDNLKYWAVNTQGNFMIKNIPDENLLPNGNLPNLPEGYNYYWGFDGKKFFIMANGKKIDYNRLDSGYKGLVPNLKYYNAAELDNIAVIVAVKDSLVENVYASSPYYREQQLLPILGTITVILFLISVLMIIYSLLKRPEKRKFDRKLAAWSGRMWIEVKGLISLMAFLMLLAVSGQTTYRSYMGIFDGLSNGLIISFFVVLSFWWFYLMLLDLLINRRQFFAHNIINSLLKWYRKFEKRYPWQQLMLKRAYILVAIELILALLSVMFVFVFFPLGLIIAGLGIYLIYRYLKDYEQTLHDFGKLLDHIQFLKDGNMENQLQLSPDSTVYQAAQNLNTIQAGINIAVAEKIKSERMKVDLITNVSHDLKTPLTSIISYVDLLKKEENLPEHVTDYINILAQKSDRLKKLIQDLFDLSKASSETITLDLEKLDLARLIEQTLGDMEEAINESGLTLKLNIPDEPVYILSDGDKLYRVWENLISNALKYSLPGSRVYIDLSVKGENALATIKNIANYEMDFTEDEILERFVRGEKSRTSEGFGLGLSIAQTFTQACGGKLSIKIDGDLFKVELLFKTIA